MSNRPTERGISGWAVGGMVFAATIMFVAGVFQIISGISAIAEDDVFVATRNYTFDIDVTAWGWIHLIIGIILVLAGAGLFSGADWAAALGIFVAALSMIANFFLIPYFPWWAILIIAIDLWIIWSLTRPGIVQSSRD